MVIGTATKDLVNSVVETTLMPVVGILLPGETWREATVNIWHVTFQAGQLIGEVLDFIIKASCSAC